MRILLLNERKAERDAIAKALAQAAYRTEAVGDERSAIEAMSRGVPEIVIVSPAAKGSQDLVRRLRSADPSGAAYFIAILEASPSHQELLGLLACGVNDFVRRPIVDAEVIERVKAPARLLRWAKSVDKPAAFDFSAEFDATRLLAWRHLGPNVAEDLSQIAGQNFTVCGGWPKDFGRSLRAAAIPMSLAEEQVEIKISVVADEHCSQWIKNHLLGEPTAQDAAIDDVLRELANTAGGALKRAATHEGVSLTTGLPVNEEPVKYAENSAWALRLEGGPCLVVVGEILKKQNQRVSAMSLCEGMIVVSDVRSDGGVLLVAAGSRLTSSTASRLSKILGPRTFLEVAPAA